MGRCVQKRKYPQGRVIHVTLDLIKNHQNRKLSEGLRMVKCFFDVPRTSRVEVKYFPCIGPECISNQLTKHNKKWLIFMSTLELISLDYPDDVFISYRSLRHLAGFALLQSSDTYHGRFDIVTALPFDEVSYSANTLAGADLATYLNNKLPNRPSCSLLPFQGGAIGYVSYDAAMELAGIKKEAHPLLAVLPVAHFRFYDWAIVVDHYLKKATLVNANQRSETAGLLKGIQKQWNKESPITKVQAFCLTEAFKPLMSKTGYHQAFAEIHANLQSGRAYQVNLTQPFVAAYQGDDWFIYEHLSRRNPVPFAAFLTHNKGTILSFSPERFLQQRHRQLLTSPIKGSSARHVSALVDEQLKNQLIESEKNRAENIMIVDLMRHDLAKVSQAGSVKPNRLFELQSFKSVHHLVSHIGAYRQPQHQAADAFFSCFPAGSITGAPKLEAMRIIAEQELVARGPYCGSIAYFSNHGYADSSVAIRTMVATDNHLYLQAGGGVVIDSVCEEEYQECLIKIEAIVNGLMG